MKTAWRSGQIEVAQALRRVVSNPGWMWWIGGRGRVKDDTGVEAWQMQAIPGGPERHARVIGGLPEDEQPWRA